MPGATRQTVAGKLRCRILPAGSLFSKGRHNSELFQVGLFCLFLVLVFEIILSFDGNFINADPPFRVQQSSIVPMCHCIETRLIRCFGEKSYLSIIDKLKLHLRSPPA